MTGLSFARTAAQPETTTYTYNDIKETYVPLAKFLCPPLTVAELFKGIHATKKQSYK